LSAGGRDGVLRLSDAEFRRLGELFRAHCGLHFDPASRHLLERRLGRRVVELRLGSFAEYHAHLRSDSAADEELARAVDELATNETYFLREENQLGALVHELIPELRKRCAAGPSIWSAGCSSGEEPYSIILLALEAGLAPGADLHVYASDISRRALEKAREGVYREASFRQTATRLREKYFVEEGAFSRISDAIKRHVNFIHANLVDRSSTALPGAMDVIVCRNVIMYFDAETRRRVVQSFHDKLRPGGYLLLGRSESLMNVSDAFELCPRDGDLVYRKPAPDSKLQTRWHETEERVTATDANRGWLE
jgi:chemotaxis protein methyltransferase CheR